MPSYKKDNFKESNINYLNKDFSQLKNSLMNYAKAYYPNTYKDFNESSPGMMLMEMSAYVGDVLSFYIDQQYREMLLPLAEERRNVLNLAKMFGYKVKPIVPAFVDLTFKSVVNADSNDASKIDYTNAAVWDSGFTVTSATDTDLVFTTLEPIDFTISSSIDTSTINATAASGLASSYILERTVRAVSATEKTKTFAVDAPTKFLRLTIPDTNVVDIVSCIDSNNNKWYEVDFLAQDKVPVKEHWSVSTNTRSSAYYNLSGTDAFTSDVPVPYSLEYINTSKRFIRETNEDNTTSLIFGNGILKNGTTLESDILDLEQLGVTIPGQSNDLNSSIDPLLGNEYSTLGETPIQTTLTVTYRVGGGINSNVSVGDLNQLPTSAPNPIGGNTSATVASVTNKIAASGGKDEEDIEEIREKTKAFFATQNRCVTKEDYEARIMNMQSTFGNIAKVYVTRDLLGDDDASATNLDQTKNALLTIMGQVSVNNISQTNIDNIINLIGLIPDYPFNLRYGAGEIRAYILSYDRNNNLVGNPYESYLGQGLGVPNILKTNLQNYLENFKILTDAIEITDGFIINFGVFFSVIAEKFANKSQVKIGCIQKIKDYFHINKMQFSQPIYLSLLERELLDVDGVKAVNYVILDQHEDWHPDGAADTITSTFKYSVAAEADFMFDGVNDSVITTSGTEGYGWKYNFQGATQNGVVLPPQANTPGIFELKNPNQNIRGVVK